MDDAGRRVDVTRVFNRGNGAPASLPDRGLLIFDEE